MNKKKYYRYKDKDYDLMEYEKNMYQTMINSETARELSWVWDESVHKYVIDEYQDGYDIDLFSNEE